MCKSPGVWELNVSRCSEAGEFHSGDGGGSSKVVDVGWPSVSG